MDPDDPNFLNNIQKLRSAYQDGDIQALEEMIQLYNDEDQHIKARIEAGRMLANTQHPMALNAIAKMVETTSAVDFSFLKASIEMLALFRENPKASFAMVESMHILEERTNNLHLTIAENLNKVRTKDQILVLLDLYEIAKANMSRTEGMLTQILGGLGSDQVIPVLTTIAKDPNIRLGIRNKAVQILGKKSPEDVATAFAELLGDPNTNLEVREFAINTMAGVKQENLILALLNTYNTGKSQYYTLLNTMLSALGEFNEPEVKLAVIEIASSEDYPIDIRKKANIDATGKVDGNTKLFETSDNTMVFKLPQNTLKTIRNSEGVTDTSYRYRQVFDVYFDANGSTTITSGGATKKFFGTATTLQSIILKNLFVNIL